MRYRLALSLVLFVFLAAPAGANPLRIGVTGSPPFTVIRGGEIKGISVEIWEHVARQAHLSYRLGPYPSVARALEAVEQGQIDVAVGSISITANRARQVDFTQPYYMSSTGILARKDQASLWNMIKPFLRTAFFLGVGLLVAVLFLVGNIIWLAERKSNDAFPKTYWQGVGSGMWFAVVTFTTVGYGDLTPKTRTGRIIAGVWMVVAIITASSLTASIATSFTLFKLRASRITSVESLRHEQVSVVKGTTGVDFARKHAAYPVKADNFNDAVKALLDGRAAAMVFDYPVLQYYLSENPNPRLKIIKVRRGVENYGFCTSRHNPLLRTINLALLAVMDRGTVYEVLTDWGIDN